MTRHETLSPSEAAERLAIRELIEAYAHCADRRDANGQMSLFTPDTHFVVYMNAKDPTPSQELHSREALAPVFAALNHYAATTHLLGQSTILTLSDDPSHRRGVLSRAPRHDRRQHTTLDGRVAALPRHVRENGWHRAVLGAPAVRGLGGRTRALMTVNRDIRAMVESADVSV